MKDGIVIRSRVVAGVVILSLLWPVSTVRATINATGDVSPASPATWTSSTNAYVGNTGTGALTVNSGSKIASGYAFLGCSSGSVGTATVDGTGSKWTSTWGVSVGFNGSGTLNVSNGGSLSGLFLIVGEYGDGTLNVSGGGAATVSGITYVARYVGSTGAINFGSGGGTLTTQSLYVTPTQLTGTGTINASGLVSDLDLVYDSTASLTQTLNFNQPGQNITLNLSTGGDLGAGLVGGGSLTIKNGTAVNSNNGYLGYNPGSNGVATVDGVGSSWTNYWGLAVGSYGNGTLNISGGGSVTTVGTTYVAEYAGSTGTIKFGSGGGTLTTAGLLASPNQLTGTGTINANGLVSDVDLVFDSTASLRQTLNFNQPGQNVTLNLDMGRNPYNNGSLGAGVTGGGSLTIRKGVAVMCSSGYLGYSTGSVGVATVDGTGSTWTINSGLTVGNYGDGTLNITGGGTVNSSWGPNVVGA